MTGLVQFRWFDQPRFAGTTCRQRRKQLPRRRADDRSHLGRRVRRISDVQARYTVNQLIAETGGGGDRSDHDNERGGGTFLPRVTECRGDDVLGRQIEIGAGRHDDGVLAARFGKQWQVVTKFTESLCRLIASRENDSLNAWVSHQRRTQ
ncbi:unannotated protein [freshwater metagenome]|uniref:Unannotated protein n=1 Tax=freshwater metagenome TaxID=449393 RepID=A0A6J7E375_9ZZZZ